MEDSVSHQLYETALNYTTVSDLEYDILKDAVRSFLGLDKEENVKMMCRKEWAMGTFIDIYVKCPSLGEKTAHLAIARNGMLSDASWEEEEP